MNLLDLLQRRPQPAQAGAVPAQGQTGTLGGSEALDSVLLDASEIQQRINQLDKTAPNYEDNLRRLIATFLLRVADKKITDKNVDQLGKRIENTTELQKAIADLALGFTKKGTDQDIESFKSLRDMRLGKEYEQAILPYVSLNGAASIMLTFAPFISLFNPEMGSKLLEDGMRLSQVAIDGIKKIPHPEKALKDSATPMKRF
jgi:hypothetical protein